MKSHVTTMRDIGGNLLFSGVIAREDLQDLRLDRFDRMVLDSPAVSPADVLQNIQLIFFRLGQQSGQA